MTRHRYVFVHGELVEVLPDYARRYGLMPVRCGATGHTLACALPTAPTFLRAVVIAII